MLVIEVEFLHGTLRADAGGDASLAGDPQGGEWPPSPARLFSAFVAADGTGDRCRVTDGSELRVLETAPPPTIHATPGSQVSHSPLRERFVVPEEREKGKSTQEYPGRKATLVRPGTVASPRVPRIGYVFPDLDVGTDDFAALRRRAARVGYLGAADHPARVNLHRQLPPPLAALPKWEPSDRGATVLPVCDDGLLARLDAQHDHWRAGNAVRRSWLTTAHARYADPGAPPAAPAGSMSWLRLEQSVAGQHVLLLTQVLRSAVLSKLGDDAPAVVHGHGSRTETGWRQARFLAFPDVGHEYADGRLHAVGVWLPPQVEESVVARVRRALLAIDGLTVSGEFRVPVVPHDGDSGPQAARRSRWTRPAATWRTATPAVFERHGDLDEEEVARWFHHAGHPIPARVRWSTAPLAHGAVRLRPHHLRDRYDTRFTHLEVTYGAPVGDELLAVGRGRQFGLGLLAPVTRSR